MLGEEVDVIVRQKKKTAGGLFAGPTGGGHNEQDVVEVVQLSRHAMSLQYPGQGICEW